MSTAGRGRGYSGRHNRRPGDTDDEVVRTLADLSPRATEAREKEKQDMDSEKGDPDAEITSEDEAVLKELLHIDDQYQPLLVLLEQFSPMEDGIQFNRKLRHFESTITNMCPDENRLQGLFCTFRAAALLSASTARKLAGVGASFTRQQRQQLLRTALLNVIMQGTYSKLDVLERANPVFLINAANLMGDYFAEARLCNGNKVHILAAPLLHYMKALLASDDVRAHRSLATQLMQNGRELVSVLPAEVEELGLALRLRVLAPPPSGVLWLLLAADMCLNRFLPLPNSLQQFYAAHLNLTAENDSYSEVSYGSWKKSPEKEEVEPEIQIANISLTSNEDDSKPKLRPILGAGAGLLRQEQSISVSQDNFDTWSTPKSNLTKRYDLNSWRQAEEEKKEEPVYDPTVLPPNFTEFPPPRTQTYPTNYPDNFNNYLQQGDGTYIQNQYYQQEQFFPPQENRPERPAEKTERSNERTVIPDRDKNPDRINNEVQQKSARKPIENWRKEKSEVAEKKQNWTRQKSKDNINEEDNKKRTRESRPGTRVSRRNSGDNQESGTNKTPPRRHVSDVPRNHKYWDHDDRCDKDYNS